MSCINGKSHHNYLSNSMISALSSPAKSCVKVPRVCAGFSLLEVLVAGVVLALVSVLSFSVIQGVSMAWKQQKEHFFLTTDYADEHG